MADERTKDWYSGAPEKLPSLVKRLENDLSQERFVDGAVTRLYFGQPALPTGSASRMSGDGIMLASTFLRALDRLSEENVLASVLDAAVSMVVRKPAFKVVTTGGDWRKGVAARHMSRLLTGLYSASGFEHAVVSTVLDSMRCQVAAVKVSVGPTGKFRTERCLPHTLSWNSAEGPNPRNIFERHGVPRARLMRTFPELADEIQRHGKPYVPDVAFHLDHVNSAERDLVEVVEGWRKSEDDDDGRHVMHITGLKDAAVDEAWKLPVWPIVVLTWGDSYDTLAGYPLGRRILSFQRTINRMDRVIDEAQSLACPPKIMVPKGSEVTGWDNRIGGRIDFNAAAGTPVIVPGQALPPEYYNRFGEKKASAFELSGVSQSVAQGTKVAGINSGKGQRDVYDIANSRLVQDAQNLERWFEDWATVGMAVMRTAYTGAKARKMAPNTALLDDVDWDKIGDIKEDEIEVRAFITSAIPNSGAGRTETLAEWVEAGVLTQQRAVRWYANPDTSTLEEESAATEDLVRKIVESSLDDGVYQAPEPIMGPDGLNMVVDIGSKEYMRALLQRKPPPRANMELLRRLIEEAKLMVTPPPTVQNPPPQLSPPSALPDPMTQNGALVGPPGDQGAPMAATPVVR